MGTKMAVSFDNIFMSKIETEIMNISPNNLLIWKRYIDNISSVWNIDRDAISAFTNLQ